MERRDKHQKRRTTMLLNPVLRTVDGGGIQPDGIEEAKSSPITDALIKMTEF
jgi:hypothetical protein